MVRFGLLEPRTLEEACRFLAQLKEEAKVIAGGQNLLPLLRQRRIKPRVLVNIKGLSKMEYIREENRRLRIGSLTTHRAIEMSDLIAKRFPILVDLERKLGCIQTRNWGTIGGNLCQASPATDPPPALIALEAKVRIISVRGERILPLDDFFVGYQKSCLHPDEILTEVELPEAPPHSGAAYHKEVVRYNDPPIASVAAMVKLSQQKRIESVRIVLQAVGVIPLRAREAEDSMMGESLTEHLLKEVTGLAAKEARPISDIYGSVSYKREMIEMITERVLKEAARRAGCYLP